jgi:2-polyprenyl-3-methyl-5-hydroxy-6-metoxy-1,4-benzoquinol methylase
MDSIVQQQIEYYRARASEYDQWFYRVGRYDHGPILNGRWFAEVNAVTQVLDNFRPSGAVLELACGTGIWTEHLARYASAITAVDASAEMIQLNRERVRSANVTYVQADIFAWRPTRQYDVVFFGFWLSHVPLERFDEFWCLIQDSLHPAGRFFFVDSRHESTSTAKDHQLAEPTATTLARRLNDGREFQIYKIFYEPTSLADRLSRLGWNVRVGQTPSYFIYAEGTRTP